MSEKKDYRYNMYVSDQKNAFGKVAWSTLRKQRIEEWPVKGVISM